MSNRFKKRKSRRTRRTAALSGANAPRTVEAGGRLKVETAAGILYGCARGKRGWMTLDEVRLAPGADLNQLAHVTSCPKTDEVYVKPLDGRYQGLAPAEQQQLRTELENNLRRLGGTVMIDSGAWPLWKQLEYLENVIDYEVDPPCGCPASAEARRLLA